MSKIALEEVEQVLSQHKVEGAPAIIEDLQKIIDELQAEREAAKADKVPWEYAVVLYDKNGELKGMDIGEKVSAYVVQQESGEYMATILTKISSATATQNDSAKRKKSFLTNIREIFSGLKPKFLKEKKVRIKTKDAVRVLVTDGNLK